MPRTFRLLVALCIVHALIVLALWAATFLAGFKPLLPASVWVAFAWLWLAWPAAIMLHPSRSPLRVLLPALVGVVLLAPCAPTIFAFTVWWLIGFAP